MNAEKIDRLLKNRQIKLRSPDNQIASSLIISSEANAEIFLSMSLTEKTTTPIFRELYESIRQLGDAAWWILGYETQTHDASLEILKDLDFLNEYQKVKLNLLDRFKTIRHDANYRGFKVSIQQTKELIDFWNFVCKSILIHLKSQIPKNA